MRRFHKIRYVSSNHAFLPTQEEDLSLKDSINDVEHWKRLSNRTSVTKLNSSYMYSERSGNSFKISDNQSYSMQSGSSDHHANLHGRTTGADVHHKNDLASDTNAMSYSYSYVTRDNNTGAKKDISRTKHETAANLRSQIILLRMELDERDTTVTMLRQVTFVVSHSGALSYHISTF